MTSATRPTETARAATVARPQSRVLMRLIAMFPIAFAPVVYLAAPRFFGPDPLLFGIPQDLVLMVAASGWALIGVAIVWDARSRLVDFMTVLLFTIPAMALVIVGPAIVLTIQNIGRRRVPTGSDYWKGTYR